MKKIVVTAIFFSLILTGLSAQGDVRFGFQLSPTFGWMNTNVNQINPQGTNLGLKLGMVGEFYFRENYAVTSGIGFFFNAGGTLFHERGGSYWQDSDVPMSAIEAMEDGEVKLKYGIQYVEIPIGLKMRTREFGYLRYYAEPFLALGFETQATGSVKGPGVGDEAEKINIRSEVNGLNMSWGIGAGVEYSISEGTSLVGGLAYQAGFLDATRDKTSDYFEDNDPTQPMEEDSNGKVNAIIVRLGVIF